MVGGGVRRAVVLGEKDKKMEQKEMPPSQMKRLFKDSQGKEKEIGWSINTEGASELMCPSEHASRELRGRPLC